MSESQRKKNNRKKKSGASWQPFAAGFVTVAIFVFVFLVISRPDDAAPVPMMPQQEASPASTAPAAPHDHADVARISVDEAKRLLDAGEAITIDVRDLDSYTVAHIPGALQIPLQYVAGEVPWFPRDKKIITYCSCPAEETSGHAVDILKEAGLENSAALLGGIDAWQSAGYPIETGAPRPTGT